MSSLIPEAGPTPVRSEGPIASDPAYAPSCPDCDARLELRIELYDDGPEEIGACPFCNTVWSPSE